jgi:hypothetical protein
MQNNKTNFVNDDLIVGGACIIHHKMSQSRKSMIEVKVPKYNGDNRNKIQLFNSENPFTIERKSLRDLSNSKNDIKYLKKLQKYISVKDN